MTSMFAFGASLLVLAAATVPIAAALPATPVVVDLGLHAAPPSPQRQLAVQVCVGLMNRVAAGAPSDTSAPAVAYSLFGADDEAMLLDIVGVASMPAPTPVEDFLAGCLKGSGAVAKGVVRYNYTAQQAVVPNLVTLAAVLDAVPMEDGDVVADGVPVVFDSIKQFGPPAAQTAVNVTAWMYDRFGNATSTIAMINPGYDTSKNPIDPPLTGTPNPMLFDYIVSSRMFTFFMNLACIPFTDEHALMERMVSDDGFDKWPRPIPVYGYNSAWSLGGDLFEAETNCVSQHNLGQIASDGFPNLSFLSVHAGPRITEPLLQVPSATASTPYNASNTYVALVIGDGDNIGMLRSSRVAWMKQRVANCSLATGANGARRPCYPLVWTASPQATHLVPDLLRWYWAQSKLTMRDYFVMPPSGDLYSYPGQMPDDTQQAFVANTEHDGYLLNTSGTVHWEWFLTWDQAFSTVFPRYANRSTVRGFFAVNVPFDMPVLGGGFFGSDATYKIVKAADPGSSGAVVVFRPREWRGTQNTTIPFASKEYLTPQKMAAELNGLPRGTVTHIYLTSDGGANISDFDVLVGSLASHVAVVDAETVIRMALERG